MPVAFLRLAPTYSGRSDTTYRVHMRDGATNEPPNDWARLLREITSRDGWSVARLARESGVHRSTIFRWLEGDDQKSLTIRSVNLIADAAGISRSGALRAAGAAVEVEAITEDLAIELEMIDGSDLPPGMKNKLKREARRMHEQQIADLHDLAARQAAERRARVISLIEIAGGEAGAQPAT